MKTLLSTFVFCFFAVGAFAQVQGRNVEVPQQINAFVQKHYPSATVTRYKKDVERSGTEHKVYLSEYTKLEFNDQFQITEIEGESAVPAGLVPATIASYVKANYAGNSVVKWEKKRNKQEVELNNGLELEFDLNGKFLRIDR